MKASLATVFSLTLALSLRVPGQQEELAVHQVAGSLLVITGAGCNVVFWITAAGILVVDSGEKPSLTAKVLSKIKEVSDRPIRYVVFTHHHHMMGAEDFPQSAILVGHMNTRDNIGRYQQILREMFEKDIAELEKKVGPLKSAADPEWEKLRRQLDLRMTQYEGIKRPNVVLPQLEFDSRLVIQLGGQKAEILHLGPGHTNGDVLVHFPTERVIHLGDLLFTNGWVPRLDGDAGASVDNWSKIFELVAKMDVAKIIPGHGEAVDKEGFIRISKIFIEYLTDLKAEVIKYINQGDSLEKIKAELKMPKYRHLGMAEILLPWNIEAVCKETMAPKAIREPNE